MERNESQKNGFPYEDIIHLSRPVSKTHPPMAAMERAAQFSPFAALTGYDTAIREASRQREQRREKSEEKQETLNRALQVLLEQKPNTLWVKVTYFQADEKKTGGVYETRTGLFLRVDEYQRQLCFADGHRIGLDDIDNLEWVKGKEGD